jgi:hypothetical protein
VTGAFIFPQRVLASCFLRELMNKTGDSPAWRICNPSLKAEGIVLCLGFCDTFVEPVFSSLNL